MSHLPLIETDEDLLLVLRQSSNDQLDPLVAYVCFDKDGASRLTEELTALEVFKKNYPRQNHAAYVDELASEIQKFGANSFVNLFRGGKGVTYKEIVCDVAGKLSVKYDSAWGVEAIETNILLKVLEGAYAKMDAAERKEFLESIGEDTSKGIPAVLPLAAIQALIKVSGFAAYRISLIIANAVAKSILGRGLTLGANAGLTRGLSILAGPIGWVITGLWTVFDIASPAYRVTIPCVLQVAMLRRALDMVMCHSCGMEHSKKIKAKFCSACGAPLQRTLGQN